LQVFRRFAVSLVVVLTVVVSVLLAGCQETDTADIPEPTGVPENTIYTSVFYSTGRTVVEELHLVDEDDMYMQTFAELLAAQPQKFTDIAIVQPEAEILGITVEDGVMTIDWSRDVLAFEATDEEKPVALASILLTAGQFPEVDKVIFTVEGQTSGEIGGHDIEYFWGRISLKGQPFDVLRPPTPPEDGQSTEEATSTPTTSN
jgi:hypothetical protein